MEIKIGDRFWVRTGDSWNYRQSRDPRMLFNEYEVVGETSRSWIVAPVAHNDGKVWNAPRLQIKVPKSKPFETLLTDEARDLRIWADANRHRIASAVGHLSPEWLRQVADLIGYVEPIE